jgi:hypothetical protein
VEVEVEVKAKENVWEVEVEVPSEPVSLRLVLVATKLSNSIMSVF